MRSALARNTFLRFVLANLFWLAAFGIVSVSAQTDAADDFPPPLKTISKNEKNALAAEKDTRKRAFLYMDLMEKRLQQAEEASRSSNFRKMFLDLGVFQGLMEGTLDFLYSSNRKTEKDYDNFKKYEMTLRAFTPRIEVLRRESPERYDKYLQSVLKQVRDTRSKAVEPLFGDNVVPRERQNQ